MDKSKAILHIFKQNLKLQLEMEQFLQQNPELDPFNFLSFPNPKGKKNKDWPLKEFKIDFKDLK